MFFLDRSRHIVLGRERYTHRLPSGYFLIFTQTITFVYLLCTGIAEAGQPSSKHWSETSWFPLTIFFYFRVYFENGEERKIQSVPEGRRGATGFTAVEFLTDS